MIKQAIAKALERVLFLLLYYFFYLNDGPANTTAFITVLLLGRLFDFIRALQIFRCNEGFLFFLSFFFSHLLRATPLFSEAKS